MKIRMHDPRDFEMGVRYYGISRDSAEAYALHRPTGTQVRVAFDKNKRDDSDYIQSLKEKLIKKLDIELDTIYTTRGAIAI